MRTLSKYNNYSPNQDLITNLKSIMSSSLLLIKIMMAYLMLSGGQLLPRLDDRKLLAFTEAHVVLTRDDNGQSLVLTGEDGKGGKGGGGDQLVIAGNNMGGGHDSSNVVMQDAANREGDVVINGNSMIIPGEDGHIVLADGRSRERGDFRSHPPMMNNLLNLWAPYINSRLAYRILPFFGDPFG